MEARQIARGDLIRRKDAVEAGGAGAPVLTDDEKAITKMSDADFDAIRPKTPGLNGSHFEMSLSSAMERYRRMLAAND